MIFFPAVPQCCGLFGINGLGLNKIQKQFEPPRHQGHQEGKNKSGILAFLNIFAFAVLGELGALVVQEVSLEILN
jgi:hypothetical protein